MNGEFEALKAPMKPILFNTDMVRAILDGRKTVTRRVVRRDKADAVLSSPARLGNPDISDDKFIKCLCTAPCEPGDLLYVRETWRIQAAHRFEADCRIEFKAGGPMVTIQFPGCRSQGTERREYDAFLQKWDRPGWHPSVHMPKEAARLFLRVKDVRVERLQDISKDPPGPKNQVIREGFKYGCDFIAAWQNTMSRRDWPVYGWAANPWAWVIEFERISKEAALEGGNDHA